MSDAPLPAWPASVHHDGSGLYVSALYPRLGDRVRLRLRLAADAPVRQVYLRTFPDGEQAVAPLTALGANEAVQWWETSLAIQEPSVHYRFILAADDGIWWYSAGGMTRHDPLDSSDFRILASYNAPDWVHSAVFYQIFPDRFANGDPATDPQPHEYEYRGRRPTVYPWGEPPPPDAYFPLVFYGGDLPGIQARLDYLTDLGVNALYLNPVFTAHSNHKYDVADYEQVDPHFGGDSALIALRQALTGRGMRYILDIVPNHCGYWHRWFLAARGNPRAPEAAFFTFTRHPDEYASWLGVWSLPKLNYADAELRRRIYAGPEAVFRRWLRAPFSADGWRVDVANMLGRQGEMQLGVTVAQGIRAAVKETSPDAYLLGENFFDASPQLQGDQWDGVMNYAGFSLPLGHWLGGYQISAMGLKQPIQTTVSFPTTALATAWRQRLAAIPWAIALQQYNLLGSHDTPRFRSRVNGNDALHRLAALIQFTFPGAPAIYYGEEIGLLDDDALHSRGCMVWDSARWDHALREFYQALIALRRQSSALQTGGFQILAVEPDCLAYQREDAAGRWLVVANRSATPRAAAPLPVAHGGIPDGATFTERFSGQRAVVTGGQLSLPTLPQGGSLWEMV